ncbi:hypothetical protein AKJ53_01445 [candidate division MSBL1 archaeon SCGC-AAA382F02]|uniref:ABC transporter permease n=1 Tax=candidate division MSBL1 archaeon SCGC-AAA382F02 TaxID=1698282 RepID=A0A133VI06_9EURY|nr:hypothetical protein AKJ53_01445 [candidate division MSBL1 archaeon SCGC-AAA382F02]
MRIQTVLKKAVEDFTNPRFLLPFLAVFFLIGLLFTAGFSTGLPSGLSDLPLMIQERELTKAFTQLTFLWYAGIPIMILIAIISANQIAKEEEEGSLRILLSKPVRRWEVILGKFLAIMVFSFLIVLTGLSLGSILLFHVSGASSSALGGSVITLMSTNLVYALFLSFFISSIATGISVLTGSRLKTAMAVVTVFVLLFFGFIIIRMGTEPMGIYQDYGLYSADINYNLGNSYIFIHNSLGGEFAPPTQSSLSTIMGTFDASGADVDPLVGGMPTSLPKKGYIPPAASFAGILLISIGALSATTFYFERKDIM